MLEVVIEIIAKASQSTSKGVINFFRSQVGEILPLNVESNLSGWIIRKYNAQRTHKSSLLASLCSKDQLLVAKFVGANLPFKLLEV